MQEDSICLFPPILDPCVGVFLVTREGGSPRLLTFLNRFSERVDSESRVDVSSDMIPSAIDSSYHSEDVDPSLICILCHEDSFQDFFVQEYGCRTRSLILWNLAPRRTRSLILWNLARRWCHMLPRMIILE